MQVVSRLEKEDSAWKKMSRGQSQRRTDSQKRTLERCKSKGKARDVIDIDSYRSFIIIDGPEPSKCTSSDASTSGKDKTPVSCDIICIEDDDDDESVDRGDAHNGSDSGIQDARFTSNNKSQPVCNNGRELFSKLSKCCEHDDSDCCIQEVFPGNIRQEWEEASVRKKMFGNVAKGQFDFQDKVGPARFNAHSQNSVNVDITAEAQMPKTCQNHENNKSDAKSLHADLEETIQQELCKKSSYCNIRVVKERASNFGENFNSQVKLNPLRSVSNDGGLSDVHNNIIGDREMLKKTEAYKRAQEEEWASRQKELQIQAEEAQRLRKRRKAETQRLLETERRQKQRLEEVREAQKKDEETLNLKEQLRTEVRMQLDKLEVNCRDMASLLRGLGIDIGGSVCPSSSEVRAAYKKALLSFHPDRASRSDIRQQIEAEEKFKLISRSKEKFML